MSSKNGKNATGAGRDARASRRPARAVVAATVSGALATLLLAAGCGTESTGATVPEGWGKLTTPAVTVAHPPRFEAQGAAERSKYNAAAATLSDESGAVGMITVQLDFTDADSVEEAAIGAEAGIALGSTLGKQEEITVSGPDGDLKARRVTFEFTQKGSGGGGAGTPGGTLDPKAGTRVDGVIVVGLDSRDKTYAVRIDAVEGKLDKGDLKKIIDSISVE